MVRIMTWLSPISKCWNSFKLQLQEDIILSALTNPINITEIIALCKGIEELKLPMEGHLSNVRKAKCENSKTHGYQQ